MKNYFYRIFLLFYIIINLTFLSNHIKKKSHVHSDYYNVIVPAVQRLIVENIAKCQNWKISLFRFSKCVKTKKECNSSGIFLSQVIFFFPLKNLLLTMFATIKVNRKYYFKTLSTGTWRGKMTVLLASLIFLTVPIIVET